MKGIKMIPEKDIPQLVWWLMDIDILEDLAFHNIDVLQDDLTAALEAFNERKEVKDA